MTRSVELSRDEAELLVDLIEAARSGDEKMLDLVRYDMRLLWLDDELRDLFGMVPRWCRALQQESEE